MSRYHQDCKDVLEPTRNLFPIEVDLSQVAVKYNTTGQLPPDEEEEENEGEDEFPVGEINGPSGDADDSLLDLSGERQQEPKGDVDLLSGFWDLLASFGLSYEIEE